MKRLTKSELINGFPACYPKNDSGLPELVMKSNPYRKIVEKLKEYEDLEEQNKLLKLPCAVGDTVYVIEVDEENFTHFYCPKKIAEYKFNLQMLDLLELFGKCIFLTKEEAEAALKELERGKGNETD